MKCVVWFGLVCSVWPLAPGWAGQAFRAVPGAGLGLELPVWDWALPSLGWAFETPFSAALFPLRRSLWRREGARVGQRG